MERAHQQRQRLREPVDNEGVRESPSVSAARSARGALERALTREARRNDSEPAARHQGSFGNASTRQGPPLQASEPKDTALSPRVHQHDGPSAQAHGRAPPHPARASTRMKARSASPHRKKVYCGNNRLDPSLKANGGSLDVGTRSACFRSGFGAALYQKIDDEDAFIKKFSAPYEHLVPQKLWYKDSAAPAGYELATLSQARLRGWGAGSATLARKIARRRGQTEKSHHKNSKAR